MKKILEALRWIGKNLNPPDAELERARIILAEAKMEAEEAAKQAELERLQTIQRIERIDKNIEFIANHIKKQYHYE